MLAALIGGASASAALADQNPLPDAADAALAAAANGEALPATALAPVTGFPRASTRALVAVCETCHRPDSAAIPGIHGRPAATLAGMLRAFPGQTDVTVMHRIAVGLSAAEVDAVAAALAQASSP
jgi:cytochrome c553